MFRFMTDGNMGLALAKRVQDEGEDVVVHADTRSYADILEFANEADQVATNDTVVFGSNGFGNVPDKLREAGHNVFGGGHWQERLQTDINFAREMAESYGIKVASSDTGGMVFYTSALYVHGKLVNGSVFSSIKLNRFMDGDIGPISNGSCAIAWFWKQKRPKSYTMTLKLFEPFLEQIDYTGILTAVCVISDEDMMPYLVRFVTEPDYSVVYPLLDVLECPVSSVFKYLAAGEEIELQPCKKFTGSVKVTMPPYPYAIDWAGDVPIEITDDVYAVDIRQNGKGLLAGKTGIICYVTSSDKNIKKLSRSVYGKMSSLRIPYIQYRLDIFEAINPMIKKLRDYNYFQRGNKK